MNISLDWYDPDRTLLYMRLEGSWEMGVSRGGIEEFKQRVREVPHRVDLIAQALDKNSMSPPVWALRLGIYGIVSAPPNTGFIVMVPNSLMMLALAHAGVRILGDGYAGRIHTAATFDDARRLIEASR